MVRLLLKFPEDAAIVFQGESYKGTFDDPGAPGKTCHGRGVQLRVGRRRDAAEFVLDGPPSSMRIRQTSDQIIVLDVAYGKMVAENDVNMWGTVEHPEWALGWSLGPDGTLTPVAQHAPGSAELRLGIKGVNHEAKLVLVPRTANDRVIVLDSSCSEVATMLSSVQIRATAVAAAMPGIIPGTDFSALLVKSPNCGWLGSGPKAIVFQGESYKGTFDDPGAPGKTCHGRGVQLRVGRRRDAAEFVLDGPPSSMRIRQASDQTIVLDVVHGKMVAENDVHMWGTVEHPEWALGWSLGPDGTLAPVAQHAPGSAELRLGIKRVNHEAKLVLVPRTANDRVIVLESSKEQASRLAQERAEAEAYRSALARDAAHRLNVAARAQLAVDGFIKLPGAIAPELVRRGRKEINREIGTAQGGTDHFKAKAFASHPAITDLFRASLIPSLLAELLGGEPAYYCNHVGGGQLALRFPGDHCRDGTTETSEAHFDTVRKRWHIDGCASNFLKGTTDHFGEIHNFTVLVGVLLSDVPEPMSGELCVYPGSHTALAHFFACNPAALEEVRTRGSDALPTGQRTDELFKRPCHHCTGRAGDVFLANYMTAHLIAPNTSPDIRYAVYFRVNAPNLKRRIAKGSFVERTRSMLTPWLDWKGVGETDPASETDTLEQSGSMSAPPIWNELEVVAYDNIQKV